MKKIFTFFLVLAASMGIVYASDTQVDGIWYDFDSSTKTASVTYRGSSYNSYYGEYSGSVTIPETVTYNGTTYSVTSIGEDAFYKCSSLTSVTIPNSVTSIGELAFFECSSLTSVTIPNSVTCIGSDAFLDCSSLTSITIPESVTSIGEDAFSRCSALTAIVVKAGNTTYDSRENCNAIIETTSNTLIAGCQKTIIPNSVTSIGNHAFYGCSSLTSVTIPNSVTSIGGYAFYGCSSLTSVTIPNSVTSIGEGAFRGCSGLTSITIPNSVTSIGDDAFYYCSSLTSVTIPNSVTSIGRRAFCSCEKLGTLVLGDKVKSIGYEAFYGCNKLYHIYCYAPEPPVIEEEVFTNYNVNLYVPCNYLDNYKYDRVFGSFRYIQCIDSEDVTTNDVVVTPGVNDVTITWPTEDGTDTYSIVIKKGNDVFCTLTFNAEGQLLNIAFAPGRYGNHPAQYAEQAGKGYRFTVTSLESGTKYGYNIEVKDASNKTIKSHSGEFTTQSTTSVDNITTNNANIQKIMRDGQFIIVRDGVEYNAVGQEM